ncbi:7-carboxy-7-deazaguanine synthase QueE [Haloferula chungangensis]|uniref:7-carboxy-7-deazaguanine synthase n=1 Tax=Haloferula chungangensis TaxID=1048331 RepID=A0ABW2L7J7_9BACT
MKLAKLNDGPEIFHTIQGEGVSAGLPAIFIRASRCNLHCRWCDTDYTWNFEGTPWPHDFDADPNYHKHRKSDVTIELSPAEIAEHVLRFPTRRVVLTGGEPLLQQSAWLELITLLRKADPAYLFEVETNGTRMPTPDFEAAIDQLNISPKLANSGMEESTRLIPEVLTHLADNPKAWFKFVASSDADVAEIESIAARFKIPSQRILLMPEGRTATELDRHSAGFAAEALARGWRFCDRLHVRLWGDKRGV